MAELDHTSLVAILVRDREGGRVTVDGDGQPIISYRLSPYDARHLRQGLAAAARVLEAAGARAIWTPHARKIGYQPDGSATPREAWLATLDRAGFGPNQAQLATFHQMASCRMGANARTSVVTPEHQVWGVPGLYVADASTFPTSSGVNPMLTIMAMAYRAAGAIASAL
jgi:choline dehydrogenase-like flavoprotein